MELTQPIPIDVVIRVGWLVQFLPRGIRDRPFRDDAHLFFARGRKSKIEWLLVRNVDGGLQRIEGSTFHRKLRRETIAAVSNIARVALRPCALQGCDDVALSQGVFRAAMQLNKVKATSFQAVASCPRCFRVKKRSDLGKIPLRDRWGRRPLFYFALPCRRLGKLFDHSSKNERVDWVEPIPIEESEQALRREICRLLEQEPRVVILGANLEL